MKITSAAQTDMGAKRTNNEDSYYADGSLFLVADGVGGHQAGEVASKMAADIMGSCFKRKEPYLEGYDENYSMASNRLASAIRLANKAVHEASKSASHKGMASTVAAVHISDDMLSIAHVGDSRAYLIRAASIIQLTDDHSVVNEQVRDGLMTKEQAKSSHLKHVVTRALGPSETVDVDVDEVPAMDGDRVIICSDGLTDMVSDEFILKTVISSDEPKKACARLVNAANKNGGKDNITIVAIYFEEKGIWDIFKKLFSFKRR